MSAGCYLGMQYYITKAEKSHPYPTGLNISAGTKKSISERECHSIFGVESTIFFLFFGNFLSPNFLPTKANNKRVKERDSFVVVLWHEKKRTLPRILHTNH